MWHLTVSLLLKSFDYNSKILLLNLSIPILSYHIPSVQLSGTYWTFFFLHVMIQLWNKWYSTLQIQINNTKSSLHMKYLKSDTLSRNFPVSVTTAIIWRRNRCCRISFHSGIFLDWSQVCINEALENPDVSCSCQRAAVCWWEEGRLLH